jgi:phosphomannomutase
VLLRTETRGRVVHDPRLTWNTVEIVKAGGGEPVLCKSGHAFIKQRMRDVDGVYGGEMSAHHYFRRFAYCDSGMIPWLLIAQIISEAGAPLSKLVGDRIALFPVSGELNYRVPDLKAAMAAIESRYASQALSVDRTDGQSYEFADWRFNLRPSNTEPLLRLNVEARGSETLMREKTGELLGTLESHGAVAADH